MPEMLLRSSTARKCGVVIELTSNKHTKTVVETDVIGVIEVETATDSEKEAEDHHQTMNASHAEKPVIGKNFTNI